MLSKQVSTCFITCDKRSGIFVRSKQGLSSLHCRLTAFYVVLVPMELIPSKPPPYAYDAIIPQSRPLI